ncbi:MAG: hypothetical protein A2X28_02110 [Elusimicrobia bacterium GWA2_56_46]|nr:MAG: hypothetical protein A2X28_02110 [Elusimicrobia bacterium GWA2_56_46]OGR55436.1 MAG: hypothetical protein A2X39_00855 [Elusimicrobia bacterium GWC2_56_31]HBW21902.1 hypothetical protein [Elusimicrobiota bacterium]
MKEPAVTLVVPFYNEKDCAERAVGELASALDAVEPGFELLLVENASTDGTREILRRAAAGDPRIRVVELDVNIGYGGAVLKGLSLGRGEWVGFTCGDGEISASDTAWMCSFTRVSGLDFCKAKRLNRRDGAWRKFLSLGYHFLVGSCFSIHVTDINGYPVLMRRAVYSRLRLSRTDWVFNVEMLLRLRQEGLRMAEVDVTHRPRLGGRSHVSLRTPVEFFFQLVSLWRRNRLRRETAV